MPLCNNRPVFKERSFTTTLGLVCKPKFDNFQVKNNTTQVQTTDSTASTKPKVLDPIASIFDPLRLLSSAVIAFKMFLEKILKTKYNVMKYFQPIYNKSGISC